MSIAHTIKSNPTLKNLAHWSILIPGQSRPRLWIKWLVNPFVHKRGRKALIRRRVRLDVAPWNQFILGAASTIEDFSVINNAVGDVIIGKDTRVGISNTLIGPVTIGDHVRLAQNVTLSGLNHTYEDVSIPISEQGVTTKQVSIEDECWIGANVVVVPGVTIGKHSIIAAGSVVTKNIPPYSVAVGNPARIMKQYDFSQKQWIRLNQH